MKHTSLNSGSIQTTGSSRGFTLVETLVAIAIIMIAIVGPFYSVQQAIMVAYTSRDQLIASSLAQEAAEYIYFLRDNNYLATRGWTTYIDKCTSTYGCVVDPSQHDQTLGDPTTNSVVACSSGGCPALKLSSAGIYTQSGSSTTTRFTRTVKVVAVSGTQIQVTVQVAWITEHVAHTVVVTENLYNWL